MLTETGLLPGALIRNAGLTFVCKSVSLSVETTNSIFTTGYDKSNLITIPIAHHDGNYFASNDTLELLENEDEIAFRYSSDNPNGSLRNIAGILNEERNVLGMMPHPERAADAQHGSTDGITMFATLTEQLAPMVETPIITDELIAEHGFTKDEYKTVLAIMGRVPSFTELGIFSVMWSEHCSYKSSKKWLKTLPTDGPQVIQGPGENAGVVDIGDGKAAIFKIESHNHPSFIEPYQGAATGVGGILRDVFTMGARPVANLNALRFGSPNHPKNSASYFRGGRRNWWVWQLYWGSNHWRRGQLSSCL